MNLSVNRKYSGFLQPNLVVKFLRDFFYTPSVCVTPALQIGWIATIPLSSGNYKVRLFKQVTCEPDFVVKSFHKTTNQLLLGAELVFRTNNDWIVELGYKAYFLNNNSVRTGKVRVEKRF